MICKGKARGAGGQLAAYLADYLTAEKNERVEVLEVVGSPFPDLHRSLLSWEAEAQRGKTRKPFWHAQISPAHGEYLTREQQLEAVSILGRKLGLDRQPHAAVVHRKDGNEHIHVVWSRIDRNTGKAVRDQHTYRKNCDAAREMEQRFGLQPVETPKFANDDKTVSREDRREKSKKKASQKDFQRGKRSNLDPRERKRVITECWHTSDCGKALRSALQDANFVLAYGNQRDYVVVDSYGDIHSLARQIKGAYARDVRERLKDVDPASVPKALHVQQELRAAKREREGTDQPRKTTQAQPQAPPAATPRQDTDDLPERDPLDPNVILADLTQRTSTFTATDLRRNVEKRLEATRSTDSPDDLVQAVRHLTDFVTLGNDRVDRPRYTSRDMLQTELQMRDTADAMHRTKDHGVEKKLRDSAPRAAILGAEQKTAFEHVTSAEQISLIVGFAGTGKSTMLGAAREAWEAQGYRVRGAALSSMAAASLQEGSGIESRTLKSTLWRIQNVHASEERVADLDSKLSSITGRDQKSKLTRARWMTERDRLQAEVQKQKLTSRDVVVLDEAAMVGSREVNTLLQECRKSGAKVVMVGDAEQLQAIDAGGAFRSLKERLGAVEITNIRRQKEDWQRQATKDFAESFTEEALGAYRENGYVHKDSTQAEARTRLIDAWSKARHDAPEKTRLMMAFTRADVAELNQSARDLYRKEGLLHGEDVTVQTEQGKKQFARGDRFYFLQNDLRLGVKNGSLGTVESVALDVNRNANFAIKLDDGKTVSFSTEDYAKFSHGYASTIHKAQGASVDQSYLLASHYMDRHAAYVGMSRHREAVNLYYSEEEFGSYGRMVGALSRDRRKDVTLDYLDRAEQTGAPQTFWEKVRPFVKPSEEHAKEQRIRAREDLAVALGLRKKDEAKKQRDRLAEILHKRRPERGAGLSI